MLQLASTVAPAQLPLSPPLLFWHDGCILCSIVLSMNYVLVQAASSICRDLCNDLEQALLTINCGLCITDNP